jgi:hypothetical protein
VDQPLREVLQGPKDPRDRTSLVCILPSDRWCTAVVHAPRAIQDGDRLGVLRPVHQRVLQPPTWRNPLGELVSLRKTGTVDDYTKLFLAHVARTRPLDK